MGLPLDIARLYMLQWDQQYLNMIKNMGLSLDMFAHYEDDMVIVTRAVGQGWYWDKEDKSLKWSQEQFEMDMNESPEERKARVLSSMANSINLNIQTTTDLPRRNSNGNMPVLDLQIWVKDVEGIPNITHTFL